MTSHQAQLQALIIEIESLLGQGTPRLPWAIAGEPSQQRRLLEQALVSLKEFHAGVTLKGNESNLAEASKGMPTSAEATSQQVLQALLQEMQYLRTQTIQPLTNEVAALQQQREKLQAEVSQLQSERLQIAEGETGPEQLNPDWISDVVEQLRTSLLEQLKPQLKALQTQITDTPALYGATQDPREVAADLPQLHPQQRLEQLRQIQAQTDYMLLKLDSSLRAVFESMEQGIQSYCDSLGQGLEAMHGLGQQGEVIFKAFINHLAQQLGQESGYLSSSGQEEDARLLEGEEAIYEDYDEQRLTASGSPTEDPLMESILNLDEIDLDADDSEGEEITLFQLDDDITQLQLEDEDEISDAEPEAEAIAFETDEESTLIQTEPIPWDVAVGIASPDAGVVTNMPEVSSMDGEADNSGYAEEIDALYESLFGEGEEESEVVAVGEATSISQRSTEASLTAENLTNALDEDENETALDETLLGVENPGLDFEVTVPDEAVADFSGTEPTETESENDAIEPTVGVTLDSSLEALLESSDIPTEPEDINPQTASETSEPGTSETGQVPVSDNELEAFWGSEVAAELDQPEASLSAPDVITSLEDLLPASEATESQRPVDSLAALEESSEDTFIPAPPEEDLLASETEETTAWEIDVSLDDDVIEQLNEDLSRLEDSTSDNLRREISFDLNFSSDDEVISEEDAPTLAQPLFQEPLTADDLGMTDTSPPLVSLEDESVSETTDSEETDLIPDRIGLFDDVDLEVSLQDEAALDYVSEDSSSEATVPLDNDLDDILEGDDVTSQGEPLDFRDADLELFAADEATVVPMIEEDTSEATDLTEDSDLATELDESLAPDAVFPQEEPLDLSDADLELFTADEATAVPIVEEDALEVTDLTEDSDLAAELDESLAPDAVFSQEEPLDLSDADQGLFAADEATVVPIVEEDTSEATDLTEDSDLAAELDESLAPDAVFPQEEPLDLSDVDLELFAADEATAVPIVEEDALEVTDLTEDSDLAAELDESLAPDAVFPQEEPLDLSDVDLELFAADEATAVPIVEEDVSEATDLTGDSDLVAELDESLDPDAVFSQEEPLDFRDADLELFAADEATVVPIVEEDTSEATDLAEDSDLATELDESLDPDAAVPQDELLGLNDVELELFTEEVTVAPMVEEDVSAATNLAENIDMFTDPNEIWEPGEIAPQDEPLDRSDADRELFIDSELVSAPISEETPLDMLTLEDTHSIENHDALPEETLADNSATVELSPDIERDIDDWLEDIDESPNLLEDSKDIDQPLAHLDGIPSGTESFSVENALNDLSTEALELGSSDVDSDASASEDLPADSSLSLEDIAARLIDETVTDFSLDGVFESEESEEVEENNPSPERSQLLDWSLEETVDTDEETVDVEVSADIETETSDLTSSNLEIYQEEESLFANASTSDETPEPSADSEEPTTPSEEVFSLGLGDISLDLELPDISEDALSLEQANREADDAVDAAIADTFPDFAQGEEFSEIPRISEVDIAFVTEEDTSPDDVVNSEVDVNPSATDISIDAPSESFTDLSLSLDEISLDLELPEESEVDVSSIMEGTSSPDDPDSDWSLSSTSEERSVISGEVALEGFDEGLGNTAEVADVEEVLSLGDIDLNLSLDSELEDAPSLLTSTSEAMAAETMDETALAPNRGPHAEAITEADDTSLTAPDTDLFALVETPIAEESDLPTDELIAGDFLDTVLLDLPESDDVLEISPVSQDERFATSGNSSPKPLPPVIDVVGSEDEGFSLAIDPTFFDPQLEETLANIPAAADVDFPANEGSQSQLPRNPESSSVNLEPLSDVEMAELFSATSLFPNQDTEPVLPDFMDLDERDDQESSPDWATAAASSLLDTLSITEEAGPLSDEELAQLFPPTTSSVTNEVFPVTSEPSSEENASLEQDVDLLGEVADQLEDLEPSSTETSPGTLDEAAIADFARGLDVPNTNEATVDPSLDAELDEFFTPAPEELATSDASEETVDASSMAELDDFFASTPEAAEAVNAFQADTATEADLDSSSDPLSNLEDLELTLPELVSETEDEITSGTGIDDSEDAELSSAPEEISDLDEEVVDPLSDFELTELFPATPSSSESNESTAPVAPNDQGDMHAALDNIESETPDVSSEASFPESSSFDGLFESEESTPEAPVLESSSFDRLFEDEPTPEVSIPESSSFDGLFEEDESTPEVSVPESSSFDRLFEDESTPAQTDIAANSSDAEDVDFNIDDLGLSEDLFESEDAIADDDASLLDTEPEDADSSELSASETMGETDAGTNLASQDPLESSAGSDFDLSMEEVSEADIENDEAFHSAFQDELMDTAEVSTEMDQIDLPGLDAIFEAEDAASLEAVFGEETSDTDIEESLESIFGEETPLTGTETEVGSEEAASQELDRLAPPPAAAEVPDVPLTDAFAEDVDVTATPSELLEDVATIEAREEVPMAAPGNPAETTTEIEEDDISAASGLLAAVSIDEPGGEEPSPPPEAVPIRDEWFLGLDFGTGGLSAVLMNRLNGAAHPLYWSPRGATASGENTFRLPTIAALRVNSGADVPTWELQAVGISALIERTENSQLQLLNSLKPLLKVGIPHQTEQGVWEPFIQWSNDQAIPLDRIFAGIQALIALVRQSTGTALDLGAVGLGPGQLHQALDELQGIVVGHPSNWSDTYCINLREAILSARLIDDPSQIFFVEEAIAAVLSGLPDPNDPPPPGRQTQTLYQCNWQGGTVVISAGASCTELGIVDLPHPLDALSREDFALRNFAYGGDALDLDIICQLLFPSERRKSRESGNRGQGAANWQPTSAETANAQWNSLSLESLDLPQLAEPDVSTRVYLRQHLETSKLGQSLLEAARYLKLILQNQAQFHLELADQSWRVLRRDLESRVLVPYIQRLNQHLNGLLSQTGLSSQAINQVICTGANVSFATIAKWLRQKFPNATIIQDTYPGNRPPSCSRVAYGLVNLCRYPQVLDVPRHQYSDYFLLHEIIRILPDQPLPLSGILHLLEEQGINTEACHSRILAILEGHLPPGLLPDGTARSYLSHATLNQDIYPDLSTDALFTRQNGQIYMPNAPQRDRMRIYLTALLANKHQSLAEPMIAQLVIP